jgi:transposase InsO family protein
MVLAVLTGWLDRQEWQALENRVLRCQLGQQRIQFTDADRRRLAVRYTRIQGALKNVGHRVGRSTIARILKAHGVSPVPARPTSWQTFLRAHWGAIAGADFFTTEVWTWRGLVTYYTVFVIDLSSRRVQIVGSTPHPNELFMRQVSRALTASDDGLLGDHRMLISREVRRELGDAGVHVVLTPFQAPNGNAHAERFVRSIKYECLDRMVLWVSAISDGPSRNSSSTTIANAIIKDLRIGSSRGQARVVDPPARFVGASALVAC